MRCTSHKIRAFSPKSTLEFRPLSQFVPNSISTVNCASVWLLRIYIFIWQLYTIILICQIKSFKTLTLIRSFEDAPHSPLWKTWKWRWRSQNRCTYVAHLIQLSSIVVSYIQLQILTLITNWENVLLSNILENLLFFKCMFKHSFDGVPTTNSFHTLFRHLGLNNRLVDFSGQRSICYHHNSRWDIQLPSASSGFSGWLPNIVVQRLPHLFYLSCETLALTNDPRRGTNYLARALKTVERRQCCSGELGTSILKISDLTYLEKCTLSCTTSVRCYISCAIFAQRL